ncbi:ac transposable element-derived 5, partial [Paramuricea clavata]
TTIKLCHEVLTGPDLLNPLFGVLLRFRQGRIALCSDIKDMFLQMRVVEEDLPALRFLFRDSKDEEPSVYQCLRRPFGERSAPTCANYIMKRNAEDFQQQYPTAAEAVRKNLYVDDSLNSLDDEDEAVALRQELTELMKHGGFTLTKWLSNSQTVMKEIPESDKVPTKEVKLGDLPTSQALGVHYNAQTDSLHLSAPKKPPAKTPREILSRIASVWDPHGWLSPFTIRGRVLQQQLCLEEVGWDTEIPEDQLREWKKWEDEVQAVESIIVPRCLRSSDDTPSEVQLHVFSDSSKQAKYAAGYLRFSYPNGNVHCSLVAARSRVAPKKRMTIPRLELDAACMAVKLALTLIEELDYHITAVTFWIDSMVVLHWIHQPSNRYRDYVAHRIVDIGEDLKKLEADG